MSAKYSVKRTAELVGVSASTLRAWERRYGVAPTERSAAGYRLYDDAAVREFVLMNGLIADGLSAREAAAEVRRRSAARDADIGPDVHDPNELAELARDFDRRRLERLLDQRFSEAPFPEVVDDWLMPALTQLGRMWKSGQVSVGGEHLVAESVRRRLAAEYDAPSKIVDEHPIVLGLPPKARHDLGLLAFAVAAKRRGLATTYLGADVPAESWALATAEDCDAAVFAVPRAADLKSFDSALGAIRRSRPGLTVAVGGAMQDRAPAGCLKLGHNISAAVDRLARRLEADQ